MTKIQRAPNLKQKKWKAIYNEKKKKKKKTKKALCVNNTDRSYGFTILYWCYFKPSSDYD